MLSQFEKDLLEDIGRPRDGYGAPVQGWRGPVAIFKDPKRPLAALPLSSDLAATFVQQVYFLLITGDRLMCTGDLKRLAWRRPMEGITPASGRGSSRTVGQAGLTGAGGLRPGPARASMI